LTTTGPLNEGDAVERSGVEVDHAHRNQFDAAYVARALEKAK
jgi:hypothetical protein